MPKIIPVALCPKCYDKNKCLQVQRFFSRMPMSFVHKFAF